MNNYYQNQRSTPMEELKRFFRSGSNLSLLILANIGVWLLVQVLKVLVFLFNSPDPGIAVTWVIHYFALPADPAALIERPWTLVTYMFLHEEIWHILFNMIWLYGFGRIFMEYIAGRKLLTVYLLGGISGGLFYVLAFNLFPRFSSVIPLSFALGASAAVMAIVTAISFYVPDYSLRLLFFGNVRIVYMAILLFVSDFFMIPAGNAGGHIAHIGGAIFGFVYAQILKNPPRVSNFSHESDNSVHQRPVSDEEYNYQKQEKQRRIDEILEKISKGGYDSLTRDEKEYLFRTSGKR